ncbi:hypothetical protein MKX03_027364 [Papaver bracteatum]|nr:hypothetical protein MKX03_027364 [Papaver bracteatum]
MDVDSPVDKAADIAKNIIRPQLNTEIPKWVALHARSLVLAEINGTFESCYKKTPQLIKGFMNGCRLVIGLDGAHLNGKFGGVILSATGIDGQNGVFPICVMICMKLRKRIPDMVGLTFISDRMKGILESVKRLFPLSNHRYCLRHLYKNFLTKGFRNPRLTQLLWQAAKAYKYHHWEVKNV